VVAVLYSYIMIRICYIFLRYDGVRRTLLDLYDARSLQLQFTSSRRQIILNMQLYTVVMSTMMSAIKTMFGPSLPSLVCRRAHVLFMLFVLGMHSDVQHVLTI
jgi:hypothetical protein